MLNKYLIFYPLSSSQRICYNTSRQRRKSESPACGKVSCLRRGVKASPMNFASMSRVKEISVFVDESGSFAPLSEDATSPYYLLCMVFHDQSVDIKGEIGNLEDSFQRMGLERDQCVHSGPLIRREQNYAHMSREERRGIFQHMLAFFRRTNISYRCFSVNKRTNSRRDAIHDTLLVRNFIIRLLYYGARI